MNKRQALALLVGLTAALVAAFAVPRPAPTTATHGPDILGHGTTVVEQRIPFMAMLAFYGVTALTLGAVFALRSRA